MELLLATRNAKKVGEIEAILATAARVRLLTLDQVGIRPEPEEDDVEQFDTFRENALAKARYFAGRAGIATLADDSGLVVPALDGAPGVRSKRFSGRDDLSGPELDRANNDLLLARLGDTPDERRAAHFVCAAAVALPGLDAGTAIGTVAGRIAPHPRGDHGFGYDPLFLLPDIGVTFAEVAPDVKNRRSHRARAFRTLAAHLPGLLFRG